MQDIGHYSPEPRNAPQHQSVSEDRTDLLDLLAVLAARWKLLIGISVLVGIAAVGVTFFISPTYTSKTTFLPPQQQQSSAVSALASLGALGGLASGSGMFKSPGEQYVSLMQSRTVQDRIIDRFNLMKVYESEYRFQARRHLELDTRALLGKKDGLISVEVDAGDAKLAADIANQYVIELKHLTSELALTEAQQRRTLFEGELKRTRGKLEQAQQQLQLSGFNPGALKAEPRAAAEGYAKLKAETTAAEVRLQAMRRGLVDTAPEIQQQLAIVGALRTRLLELESAASGTNDADYVGRYREFKYQETLFDLFAKQYELARVDETREGALIQVIDAATPAERRSRPKRSFVGLAATGSTFVALVLILLGRRALARSANNPVTAHKWTRLRDALAGRQD